MTDSLGFLIAQTTSLKSEVYRIKYPDVDYARLVPVDMSDMPWATSITHFSQDMSGKMEPINPNTTELPFVELQHSKHEVPIGLYGAALGWDIQEINQAMMLNIPLRNDKMIAARRAYDEMNWNLVLNGDSNIGWDGLINNSNVTAVDADTTGSGATDALKRRWENKEADDIILDINKALEGVYTGSNTVEMADTIALPPGVLASMASKAVSGTDTSVLRYIQQNNVYSLQTGQALTIVEIRGLENAASSSLGRMIAYCRDPQCLRYYIPKPLTFEEPQQHLLHWKVPFYCRIGGLEIRRPKTLRYVDGISA